jgi:hypothetical protein
LREVLASAARVLLQLLRLLLVGALLLHLVFAAAVVEGVNAGALLARPGKARLPLVLGDHAALRAASLALRIVLLLLQLLHLLAEGVLGLGQLAPLPGVPVEDAGLQD